MSPGSEHVGRRLTVRSRLPDGAASDVVGRLLEVDSGTLRLQRRDGSIADIAAADVIVWRIVPDRPRRTRPPGAIDPEVLTRITSRGWPAVESVPLGDWELRASGGFTHRANSAAVHGDPGLEPAAASEAVLRFYRDRGLPPLAQVVVGLPWEVRLRDLGWSTVDGERDGAIVQVAALGDPPPTDPEVVVAAAPAQDWWGLYHRIDDPGSDAARQVLTGPPVVAFLQLGSPAMAIGRVVVTGEWAGVAAVEVREDQRRRGLGRRIVATALAWAHAHGADKAYLQTMRGNTAALALYEPFGFVDHHTYAYLTHDDA